MSFTCKIPRVRKQRHLKFILNIKIEHVAFCFLIFFVLLDQNTMWSFLIYSPIYGKGFGWATGVTCLIIVLLSRKFSRDYNTIIMLMFLVAVLCFYALMTRYNVTRFFMSYVSIMVCMYLLSVSLYRNNNMKAFLSTYSNVMLTIAIVSLFFWVFGSLLNVMPGRTEVIYDWAGDNRVSYTYYYLYFENPLQNRGERFSRNIGIFPEAPGYSTFLTYGMLIDVIKREDIKDAIKKRKNLIRIIIYFVTLVSTGSSKGIIIVMAVMAIKYIFAKSNRAWKQLVKTIICSVVFFSVLVASVYLIEDKLSTGSGITRMDDFQAGLKTWMQHFFFGAGYMNGDAIRANQLVVRDNEGMSMGIAVMLGYGGLLFLLLYIGAAYYILNGSYFKTRKKEWILLCIVLLVELFISNGAFDTPWIFLIAAAYASPREKSVKIDSWREICSQV